MKHLTRVALSLALAAGLVGFGPAASMAVAPRFAGPVTGRGGVARAIKVARPGAPTITFADDAAIADDLDDTALDIAGFERALATDLARRTFRAPHTWAVVDAPTPAPAGSTAEKAVAVAARLAALKTALAADLAQSDFRAPYTAAVVDARRRDRASATSGSESAVAEQAVELEEAVYALKMRFELDLHAHNLTATETHFYIDGRRWPVR